MIEENVFGVFEVDEEMSNLHKGDDNLDYYFNHFKNMIDEVNQYHPITNDIEVSSSFFGPEISY